MSQTTAAAARVLVDGATRRVDGHGGQPSRVLSRVLQAARALEGHLMDVQVTIPVTVACVQVGAAADGAAARLVVQGSAEQVEVALWWGFDTIVRSCSPVHESDLPLWLSAHDLVRVVFAAEAVREAFRSDRGGGTMGFAEVGEGLDGHGRVGNVAAVEM